MSGNHKTITKGAEDWRDKFKLIALKSDAYCAFYNKNSDSSKILVITFSTSHGDFDTQPFADKFLEKHGFSHLHFSQAAGSDYQDLSLTDFQEIASPYCSDKTVITYGSSVGGYAAIYYAGVVNARAIAATPINRGHPVVFNAAKRGVLNYKHTEIVENPRSTHEPIIIYDDEIILDQRFMNACITPAYPNAEKLIIKHCGHGGALKILAQAGMLESVILDLINGSPVDLTSENVLRRFQETAQYTMERTRFCIDKKQYDEAVQLANRLIGMNRSSKTYRMLLQALTRSGRDVEAQEIFNKIINDFPDLKKIFPNLSVETVVDTSQNARGT